MFLSSKLTPIRYLLYVTWKLVDKVNNKKASSLILILEAPLKQLLSLGIQIKISKYVWFSCITQSLLNVLKAIYRRYMNTDKIPCMRK
jgi:hypothetical protein